MDVKAESKQWAQLIVLAVLLITVFLVGLLAGCGMVPKGCYPKADSYEYTQYEAHPTKFSDRFGYAVDDPNNELDIELLDQTLANVVDCLKQFEDEPMTREELDAAKCAGFTWQNEIKGCLIVKVPEWHVSQCSGEQVFSCNVPDASCEMKGQHPTEQCPCSCRAMNQSSNWWADKPGDEVVNNMLVTTPNLKLVPAYFTTMITGCYYPWTGRIQQCAQPALVRKTRYESGIDKRD